MEIKEIYPVISQAIREDDVEKVVAMVSSDKEILNMMTPFGTWLHFAAARGKLDIVKKLVELGLDVNIQGGTFKGGALNSAASEGHIEIVKFLLSCGAELDTSDSVKNPLFGAILKGHLEVVKLLIESGIDYTVKYTGENLKDTDALGFARLRGQTEIIKYLESIVDVSTENKPDEVHYKDMSNMSIGNLKNELKKAVAQHYKTLKDNNPDENFYGYSLLTSEDVSSVYPVANKVSAITVNKSDPMYNVYRYCPDEWSDWDDFGLFAEANKLITKLYEEMKDEFLAYKKRILNEALNALYELESEGLFGVKDDERFLIVWVSDSSNEIKKTAAKKLNTLKSYEEFVSLL